MMHKKNTSQKAETIIEKELNDAGFRMLGADKTKEKLILSILKSKDIRYLKAIPFLIYRYPIDTEKIYYETRQKKLFSQIMSITRKIFEQNNINKHLAKFRAKTSMDYEEFKSEFELQKAQLKSVRFLYCLH